MAFLCFNLAFLSCSDDDITETEEEEETEAVILDNEINDFVWKAMNSWYNWKDDVPNLADSKDDNQDSYYTYLNGYSEPEDLFDDLLYEYGTVDRFSWFIEDYDEQEASFRGVDDAFGFDFKLAMLCSDCDEVIGYVTYVVEDSPASEAGMARGDIFYKVDGQEMTISDYDVVYNYYDNDNLSLEFATVDYDTGVIIGTGTTVDLTITEVTENPIHYSSVITTDNGSKVGYLVYNGFKYTFHSELNDVFGDFKGEGITELVLDLRYNGGGSVLTSAFLASMIHGGASTNDTFATLDFNSKHSSSNSTYPFFDTAYIYNKDGDYEYDKAINRLSSLSRVYIITSGSTASASEMIINGLTPYVGEVILIGTTTYGKNVGSITLYDSSDFTSSTTINSNHTNALQPIVFQIYNSLGQSDYTNGFNPDYEVVEYISEMKPFGDVDEPLLKTALDLISGSAITSKASKGESLGQENIFSSFEKKKFSKEMYIIPNE